MHDRALIAPRRRRRARWPSAPRWWLRSTSAPAKIACMIARLKPCPPNDALRGRSHAVELIGYSQIQSRGMKAGAVVDLAECEQAVRQAVSLAERMAKVRVESVLLSVSGGRLQGQLVEAAPTSAAAR